MSDPIDSVPIILKKPLPLFINFVNAGLSGMFATCFVHPMDVLKNQMQVSKQKLTIRKATATIFYNEGIGKFYTGLTAGLLRQATYTTARLGAYHELLDVYIECYEKNPTFAEMSIMAAISGSLGAFIGTPSDVVLVRMTSDGRLPAEQRRYYKNVVDAFRRIIKEEGFSTLWRGSFSTMRKALVVNISQLTTYSQSKHFIATKFGVPEGTLLHFYASMIAGVLTAFNAMPFDVAKTRIQSVPMKNVPAMYYVVLNVAKTEGVRALWKGFWPSYCKIGPHTVLTFIFNEQFGKFYRLYFMQ